jgi:hypothetical protein
MINGMARILRKVIVYLHNRFKVIDNLHINELKIANQTLLGITKGITFWLNP